MAESDDMRLVAEYASGGSPEAFSALVARHSQLVRAAARAQLGEVDEVQDVSQTVFLLLARKAGRLAKNTFLPGWLYRAGRLAAIRYQRGELRRMRREQEAFMQSIENQNQQRLDEPAWGEVEPLLYDGMDRLPEPERDALLAHYFERQTVAAAAASLGVSQAALKKRLTRGLDHLRKFYARRGVGVSAQGLAGAIAANAVQPLAPDFLGRLCAIGVHKGAGCSPAVQALTESTLRALTWLKVKAIATWTAVAALAVGSGALAVREAIAGPGAGPAAVTGTWRIEGEARQLAPPAFTTAEATTRFVLTLNGSGQWHMQVTASPSFAQVTEMSWDGTNQYSLSHGLGGARLVGGQMVGYRDSVYIYPRALRPLSSRLAAIWWALCSQWTLGQQGEATCPSFLIVFPETKPLFTVQTLSSSQPRLGLEESRVYHNGRPAAGQAPTFLLRTVESGEADGVLYPKLVRVQQLLPDGTVGAADEVACTKVERLEPRGSYTPDLTGPVSVTDLRLPNFRAEYITTNWYTQAEVERLVATRNGVTVVSAPTLPPPPSPGRQQVRLWALLALAGASFFFMRILFVRAR
jgi:RNA polymerase sigma factor (sigma-70 family)